MNLVIDIGNTNAKAALFCEGAIIERWHGRDFGAEELCVIREKYPDIENYILSSTRKGISEAELYLAGLDEKYIRFDGTIPTPLKNLYETPHTLGADRLAGAVGAYTLCKTGGDIMICDFGTALTVDFVSSKGEYLGGSISPGVSARFRSLSDYTSRLPELKPSKDMADRILSDVGEDNVFIGKNTNDAISAGVIQSIVYEIEGYIRALKGKNRALTVFFTGGEAVFFADKFKNTIFVDYDLVLIGLNRISEYNAYNN